MSGAAPGTADGTNRRRAVVVGGWVLAAAATLIACGVPTGDKTFTAIPDGEVPFGLDETSTTSTTTTTTVPLVPLTTVETSTTIEVRLDPAEFYFLTEGRLFLLVQPLPPGFSADQVADILEQGPPPGVGLESLIEPGLIVSTSESRAVLTVDLDAATFARIPATKQTEAIGQIVLTMVGSMRRVGLVNFTIGGEPISVKKGNSLLSDVGEPLSYDDFALLLVNPPANETASTPPPTTTEAPISTVPLGLTPASVAGQ